MIRILPIIGTIISILVTIFLWISSSINASAEHVEKRMQSYVDERHESVSKRLDTMQSTLDKIDSRTIDIIKEVKK